MRTLSGGVLLFNSDEGAETTHGTWTSRSRIGHATGARQVSQSINRYATGCSPAVVNSSSEEVCYVVSGEGQCHVNGFAYALTPGTGVYIPPGTEYSVENPHTAPIVVVSAVCPEDQSRIIRDEPAAAGAIASADKPSLTVHAAHREKLPATAGREFCLLIDKDLGCQQVTQFVGWIPPSAAPFHHHTYEEVVYILDGKGILHVGDESYPFEAGNSIYLPVRVPHCLENPGPEALQVLGVFYPSGSPAAAYTQ